MHDLLTDKVVVIVGGTSGLGAGIARAAVREGASVVVTGRRLEPGEVLVDELGEAVSAVIGDVSDPEQAKGVVAQAIERHGRVDCLVNCAGLTDRGSILDTTPELFDRQIATNLRGPFFTMQAAISDMTSRGEPGTIVNISSISARGGQPYLAPYVAAKAGLAGLTKNVAHAHRFDRIRVNALNIGWTHTSGEDTTQRRWHDAGDDWVEQAGARLPMGKLGQVDEIADAVVFLLSDRSGVVTGSVIDWDQQVIGGQD
ncbi:short-chain dehydrogenase [Janibacter sp. Soil728]|uniref:SDR family oxidoreductase n=1 Tax=Janibacter sp. Soil728 TaxID=1736393 RepID=UPI0006F69E85|nr:SDR family oxidoreductase [Janibacter sp. Soil728]KRE39135.1 short-chain dehydrogenase [Janibacter sp. Soil728]